MTKVGDFALASIETRVQRGANLSDWFFDAIAAGRSRCVRRLMVIPWMGEGGVESTTKMKFSPNPSHRQFIRFHF